MFTGKVEEEIKLLWKDVSKIKRDLERKPNDEVKEARQASKMCSEYRNKCQRRQEEVDELFSKISDVSNEINARY